MSKSTKYILTFLFILAAAGLLAAGLYLNTYYYHNPLPGKVSVQQQTKPADPETLMDELVARSGRTFVDEEKGAGTAVSLKSSEYYTHYLDVDGKYQPIDTTLAASTGDYQYENTTNTFQAYFKSSATDADTIKFQVAGDRSVSFAFDSPNKAVAKTEKNTVTYANVYESLDAKYSVNGEQLLEELILKKKTDIDKISEQLKLTGVYYKEHEDGSISFHDEKTKKIVFTLPRPVMYEQKDNSKINFGLHYEVTKNADGYLLSKIIDASGKAWLESATYPVVIDPTIALTPPAALTLYAPSSATPTNLNMRFTDNTTTENGWLVQSSDTGLAGSWTDLCFIASSTSVVSDGSFGMCNLGVYRQRINISTAGTGGTVDIQHRNIGVNVKRHYRVATFQYVHFGLDGADPYGIVYGYGGAGASTRRDIALVGNYIYPSGIYYTEKIDKGTGVADATFQTGGAGWHSPLDSYALVTDATNMFIGGGSYIRVQKRLLSNGSLVTSFGSSGEYVYNSINAGSIDDIALSGSGLFVVADYLSASQGRLLKIDSGTGVLVSGFGASGSVTICNGGVANSCPGPYAVETYGSYVYTGKIAAGNLLGKFDITTGGAAPGFDGNVSISSTVFGDLKVDASNIYVAGGTPWQVVARNITTGAAVWTQAAEAGTGTVGSMAIDGTYMYVVGADGTNHTRIEKRLLTTGALVTTFGDGSSGIKTYSSYGPGLSIVLEPGADGVGYMYVTTNEGASASRIMKLKMTDGSLDNTLCTTGACMGFTDAQYRTSTPLSRYTLAEAVTSAPSALSSSDYQHIQYNAGSVIPTNASNPSYTEYCLGFYTRFSTGGWANVAPLPDYMYSSDKADGPSGAVLHKSASPGTAPVHQVNDTTSLPGVADSGLPSCYTGTQWATTFTSSSWPIMGSMEEGQPIYPDRCFDAGIYSQNGASGAEAATDNYVMAPTASSIICSRARNAQIPNVTSPSTTQLNVKMNNSYANSYNNADTTKYALQNTTNSQYYNLSTGLFQAGEAWFGYSAGTTPNWGGASGNNIINLSPNFCYTLRARTKNGNDVFGENLSSDGWSAATGQVCTLAAVPGISVSCHYSNAANRCALSTDQYYCDVTVNANGNPAGTQYQIEMYDQEELPASWIVIQPWNTSTSYHKTLLNCRFSPVQFQVKAKNGSGVETAYTTGFDALPPCPLSSFALAGRQVTPTPPSIGWTWSAPVGGVAPTSYNFYDTLDSGKNATGVTPTYFEPASPNTQHTACVTGVAGGEEGAPSNAVSTWQLAMTPSISLDCGTKQVNIATGTNPDYNPVGTQYHLQYTTNGGSTWNEADSGWQTYSETNHVITRAFNSNSCNITIQYRVKARNGANEEAPSGSSWSTSNTCTLPPDPPTWANPNHSTQTTSSITWQWTAPSCAGTMTYNIYDCSSTKRNSGSTINGTSWTESTSSSPPAISSLSPNTSNCRYVSAVGTGGESAKAGPTNAYSGIESVSISSLVPDVTTMSVSTTSPSYLSAGSSGVQILETTGWTSSWQKSISFTRTSLSPNMNYCYQARSRNGDSLVANDYTGWSVQSCKYTKAAVPARPSIQSLSGGQSVRVTLNAETPNSNPATTQYAICVTRYNSDGTKTSKYSETDGTVDWTGDDCGSNDLTGYWTTRDPGWGGVNGVVITGLDASTKYDFKAKAKNEEDVPTAFGPQATLFLVKNNVVGWAWSSNIGWLSMNCLNNFINPSQYYGYSCSNASDWGMNTEFEPTREINPLEGYAWSASGQEIKESWTGRQNVSNTPGSSTDGHSTLSYKSKTERNVAVDSDGNPHVAWIEQTLNTYKVYYAKWNGTAWVGVDSSNPTNRKVADNASGGGYEAVALALDDQNQPHIVYKSSTDTLLHYVWWDDSAGAWNTAAPGTVLGSGGSLMPSLRLYEDGSTHLPRLAWQVQRIAGGFSDVMYAQWNGTNWTKADGTIPASPGNDCTAAASYCFDGDNETLHGYASLALDSAGRPNIAWGDGIYSPVRIAFKYWNGTAWQNIGGQDGVSDTLFPGAPETYDPSIDVDSQGNPHIAWSMIPPGWGGANTRIYYVKGDKASNSWQAANGTVLNGSNPAYLAYIYDNGFVAHSPSIVVDSQGRPHIAWFDGSTPEIYYRWWDPKAGGYGAWVTVSGDYTINNPPFNASLSDDNVNISNSASLGSFSPSLALDSFGRPNIVWQEHTGSNSAPDEVWYNGWRQTYLKAGLGWISFFDKSCSNNSQKGCTADADCGGGTCTERSGVPPSGPVYGYCYNASSLRYGVCSTSGTCTEGNVGGCASPTTAHCVFETCRSDGPACSDGGTCRAASLANYNGTTREIEGWGRSLNLKEEGIKQSHNDWGWLKLGGQTTEATPQSYKLTGTEVDSQSFLGDPDVNPNNVTLYSMFGWGWQGQGTENIHTGWFEFMPVGALLGIPWVKTAYSDIYAGNDISLSAPPRGSGDYTSTFLILADGTIQGVSGYYSGSLTAGPTSSYYEPGFNPLITGAGQPLGANALAKIDVTGLVTQVNSTTKDKYGYEVVNVNGGDLSDSNATHFGTAKVLEGKIYHVSGDAKIGGNCSNSAYVTRELCIANGGTWTDNTLTFLKGTSPNTTGNGLIVVDGDLEINQNIYYEKHCSVSGTACQENYQCLAGESCTTVPLTNISEMPSVAIIVRGNIYINPMVTKISAVTVAVDNPLTATTTEGTINTGRKKTDTKTVTLSADDSYVVFNGATYTNNPASAVAQFGSPVAGSTSRTFLRFPMTNIPAGSEIKNAYLKLTGDGNACGNFTSRIYLMVSDNVPTFTAFTPVDLYNSVTSNSVSFPLATWNMNGVNQTPDIKALVQKHMDSDVYNPSNYIGFEINENDAPDGSACNFRTWEDLGTNNEPQLVIEYAPQRVSYGIAAETDDAKAWSGSIDTGTNSMAVGWNNNRAERTYLRFANVNLPSEAEIIKAHILANINGTGGAGYQVRQGLINGYPATFSGDIYNNLPLTPGISEVAQDLSAADWPNSSSVVMHDITNLIESFIARTDYVPGSALGIRLRRGSDSVETAAGANEYRTISSVAGSESQLEVDYRVPLYVSGLFVAHGYNFDRKYTKNLAASEQIVYDGRVVANTPPGLADFAKSLPTYQKVTP